MRWTIIAALVFGCGFCAAEEIDLKEVRETLDAAIDQYFKDVIDVDKKITESIDRRIRMKGNLGDLDGVLRLQKQLEIYLTEGILPKGEMYRVTRQQAEFGINRAKSRLDTAYEEAIEGLTKQGRYTDAKRIRDERLRLEQKLAVTEPELRPTKIINRARERNNPPNEQPKKDALAAGMNKEEGAADQTVPKILKEINGRLRGEQEVFIRNLPLLTDGIAKALSPTQGPLFFDSLKKISGRHAEMILEGPRKYFGFRHTTELSEEFLSVIENLKRGLSIDIFSTPISVVHFERLMTNDNLSFNYSLHLYTEDHIQKLVELGKTPTLDFFTSEHLQEDLDVALKIQPNGARFYKLWNDRIWSGDDQKLQASKVNGIEKLSSPLVLIHFEEGFDLDMLPIFEQRGKNGFRTLFINCAAPNIEFQERLENHDFLFIRIDKGNIDELINRSINDWLANKKISTERNGEKSSENRQLAK